MKKQREPKRRAAAAKARDGNVPINKLRQQKRAQRARDGLRVRKQIDQSSAELLDYRTIQAIIVGRRRSFRRGFESGYTDEDVTETMLHQYLAYEKADWPKCEAALLVRDWMKKKVTAILTGIPPQQVFVLEPRSEGRQPDQPRAAHIITFLERLVRDGTKPTIAWELAAQHFVKSSRQLQRIVGDKACEEIKRLAGDVRARTYRSPPLAPRAAVRDIPNLIGELERRDAEENQREMARFNDAPLSSTRSRTRKKKPPGRRSA